MLVYLAALESDEEKSKFEALYLTWRQAMYYTANSILHDPSLAEDAVHQAFLRIMNHMHKISEVKCPQTKSFVVIIVRNIAINLYNSRKKKPVLSFDELEDWTASSAHGPESETEARDGYDHLVDLLGRMPDGYRSVMLLKYDNGYSTQEIAALLGLTEENVKKRLQRAKRKLEQALEREEVGCHDA